MNIFRRYRITATYLEDRYPFAREAYEIEESVEVRLQYV